MTHTATIKATSEKTELYQGSPLDDVLRDKDFNFFHISKLDDLQKINHPKSRPSLPHDHLAKFPNSSLEEAELGICNDDD